MPKPAIDTKNDIDFVLKHRIVGAAFLLFFGALFVPWILGPPSVAVKVKPDAIQVAGEQISSSEIEDELLEALQDEQADDEEQVYVSKITPLDVPTQPDSAKPTAAENAKQSSTERTAERTSLPQVVETQAQKIPQVVASPAQSQSESNPPSVKDKVDVGWAVQVGIYTSTVGVNKVVADLRVKGFQPATTVVDTNQGKGTGTRVWLGPFAQRVDAAKAKAMLTEKTGEAGFIRIYP